MFAHISPHLGGRLLVDGSQSPTSVSEHCCPLALRSAVASAGYAGSSLPGACCRVRWPPIAPGGMQYGLTARPQVKSPSAAAHPQHAVQLSVPHAAGPVADCHAVSSCVRRHLPSHTPHTQPRLPDCMKRDLFSAVFDQAAANKPPLSLLVNLAFQT